MTCEQFKEAIHREIDGEPMVEACRAHAARCNECRRYELRMRALMTALGDLRVHSEWAESACVEANARRGRAWKRVAWAALSAAAAIVLLLGVRQAWTPQSGTSEGPGSSVIVVDRSVDRNGAGGTDVTNRADHGVGNPLPSRNDVAADVNQGDWIERADAWAMTTAVPLVPGQEYCISPELTLEGDSAQRYMAVTEVCPTRSNVTVVWLCDVPTDDTVTSEPTDRG